MTEESMTKYGISKPENRVGRPAMDHPISVSRLGLGPSPVMEVEGHPQNPNTEWKRATSFKMGIRPLHQYLYKCLANIHSMLTVL